MYHIEPYISSIYKYLYSWYNYHEVIAMKHALRKKFLHIRNNLDTTYQIQATEKIFKTLEESDIFKNSQIF